MKKILLLLCFSAAGVQLAAAQARVHLGVTTGFNATYVLDEGLAQDPRYSAKSTYNFAPAGFTAGIDFNKGVGLQLESILSKQGQIYEIIDIAKQAIGQRRIELTYMHLPLLFRSFSTGTARTRFNLMLGPQFSLLVKGQEVYNQYQAGTLQIPASGQTPNDPNTGQPVPNNGNGTYNYPATTQTLFSTDAKNSLEQFRKADLQIALGIGADIDLGNNLYLSAQIRGNYGFLDMRNQDLIDELKSKTAAQTLKDLAGKRSNLLVGVQIGLHWVFGGNHSSSSNTNAGVPSE